MYDSINFGEIGTRVVLYPHIIFVNQENLYLKNHIIISEFCWIHAGLNTTIGNFIHLASFCSISGGGVFILEDFSGVSAGVRIINGSEMTRGEGLTNPTIPAEFRAMFRSYVHIQRHAFIGSNVVVHPGVTIGEGAVIGAHSQVTKDIDPWTINVGQPAKAIGKRPSDKIKRLEEKVYARFGIKPFDADDLLSLKVIHETIPSD